MGTYGFMIGGAAILLTTAGLGELLTRFLSVARGDFATAITGGEPSAVLTCPVAVCPSHVGCCTLHNHRSSGNCMAANVKRR